MNYFRNADSIATILTCDQANFFFFWRGKKNTPDTILSIRLHLVQNLDFSLIGRETIDNMNLYSDWLPVKRFHIRSKNTLSKTNFHYGGLSATQRKRVCISFKCGSRGFCAQDS